MRLPILIACHLLVGIASANAASGRFVCSTDDQNVRLTVEAGFLDSFMHPLNHFRGMLMLKTGDLAAGLGKHMLQSKALTQSWSYNGELRLEIAEEASADNGNLTTRLYVIADQGANSADSFPGTYRLAVTGGDKRVILTGKTSCGYR